MAENLKNNFKTFSKKVLCTIAISLKEHNNSFWIELKRKKYASNFYLQLRKDRSQTENKIKFIVITYKKE